MTSFVIYIFISLLLLNILMYFQQPFMIFFPLREFVQTPDDWGLIYEDVTLQTEDGIELHGWYIPNDQSENVLLFFHGNAGNISHRRESIEIFHRLGLSIFIIDYRGYGQSKGKPHETGLYEDAKAAWSYLTEHKNITADQIIIFGRSIGGAIAANLASKIQARGLILESTLSSAKDFARKVFPILSRLVFLRYGFNTSENLQQVNYPVLVLHSPEDEIMPFNLGEIVFQSAHQPKKFVQMRGDHNNSFLQSQPEYERSIDSWMREL